MTIHPETLFALTVAGALLAGLLIAGIIMRARVARARQEGDREVERVASVADEKDGIIQSLETRLSESAEHSQLLQAERNDLEKRLAVVEHDNQTIPRLKEELQERSRMETQLQQELREMSASLAQEKERTLHLKHVREQLAKRERTVDALKEKMARQDSFISELNTRMAEERKAAEEKLALLNEAKSELTNQFQVLAQEILEQKGKVFSQQSETSLKTLLDPFRDQLREFKQKVDDVYVHEAKERATLKKEVETLRDLNQRISQEAINLTRALKGDKKAQGSWGELILERVLEQSGLRKGVEYESQGSFRDSEGKLLRPDVIVHLPEEKDVVIDSKVSLLAYERYASTEDGAKRSTALSEHVRAVKAHVDELSRKDYSGLKGLRSLDFVFMFMPIEAAFVAAFKEDENLFSYAFEKRIIVVTPSTLLATLKTIENIWRYERQNRNAQAIVTRARGLYDKLRLFVESMEKLGKQLDTVHGTYEEAMNRLVRGKGNVISQASRFPELGVSVKKKLPRTVTEIAEIEGLVAPEPEEEISED